MNLIMKKNPRYYMTDKQVSHLADFISSIFDSVSLYHTSIIRIYKRKNSFRFDKKRN